MEQTYAYEGRECRIAGERRVCNAGRRGGAAHTAYTVAFTDGERATITAGVFNRKAKAIPVVPPATKHCGYCGTTGTYVETTEHLGMDFHVYACKCGTHLHRTDQL